MPLPRKARLLSENRILAALPENEYQRLLPGLKHVSLKLGDVLYETGAVIRFAAERKVDVGNAVVSRVLPALTGQTVEKNPNLGPGKQIVAQVQRIRAASLATAPRARHVWPLGVGDRFGHQAKAAELPSGKVVEPLGVGIICRCCDSMRASHTVVRCLRCHHPVVEGETGIVVFH